MIFAHLGYNPAPLCIQILGLEFSGILVSPTPSKIFAIITIYRRVMTLLIEKFLGKRNNYSGRLH